MFTNTVFIIFVVGFLSGVSISKPSKSLMPQATNGQPAHETQVLSKGCNTGTYYAHPDCEKFYVCVYGLLITQSCAPGTVWWPELSMCDFPSASSCTDKLQKKEPIKLFLKNCDSGSFAPHPSDCTRYLWCLFGKYEEFACSAGLHWNQEIHTCDWPQNAKCMPKATNNSTTKTATFRPSIRQMDLILKQEHSRQDLDQSAHEHDHSGHDRTHEHGHNHTQAPPNKSMVSSSNGTQPEVGFKQTPIKKGLPALSKNEEDTIQFGPIIEPPNEIDDDLEDNQVQPVTKPTPRLTKMPTHRRPAVVDTSTTKPTTTVRSTDPRTTDADISIDPNLETDSHSGPSLAGVSCTGNIFKGDDSNCSKYYLCYNGNWMQLECPAPLHWHKNHCDLPEKAQCKTKPALRLEGRTPEETHEDKLIMGCYLANWTFNRPGKGSFGPKQVNSTLCSHIIYMWAHLDGLSLNLVPGNPELDLEKNLYGKLTQLRQTGLKVIIGVSGLTDSESRKWSRMVSRPENRKTFIESVLKFLQTWHFDGVQIAWQYPGCKRTFCTYSSVDTKERDNFAELLTELSRSLRPQGFELSAMVSASPEIAQLVYKPGVLAAELNWVAIAANDYYASSIEMTSYLVPLESNFGVNSIKRAITYWTSVLPPRHVVLGVPAYARSYTLRSAANAGLGAPVTGPGKPGPYTQAPGFLAYYEIANDLATQQWKETRSSTGTFSVRGDQWASYLTGADVAGAGAAVRCAGARGAALWTLDLDAQGDCSLLNAMRRGLIEPELPLELCTPKPA